MSKTLITDTRIADLGLNEKVVEAAHNAGFQFCTPIQEKTIPIALSGRDIAGEARTGSGKTLAFALAVLHQLVVSENSRCPKQPRALIVAPTRELAVQIFDDMNGLAQELGLIASLSYGGTGYRSQMQSLQDGVDIVIATPGRLIDYMKQGVLNLKKIEAFVVDEADRMFELGFIKDIRYILRRLPPREQRLGMLFSATLGFKAQELAHEHLNDPVSVKIDSGDGAVAKIDEQVYFPSMDEKLPLLVGLINKSQPYRAIVFVNTRHMVRKVADYLTRSHLPASGLSGDVPQKKRQRLLERFKSGDIKIMVATDVAARGIHVTDLSHVFNFDLPQDAEDYVHRIGRTGRMDGQGMAMSFACEDFAFSLPEIETLTGRSLERMDIDSELLASPPPKPAKPKVKRKRPPRRRKPKPRVKAD